MITITDSTWKDYKNTKGLLILDFWANWCNPCKAFKPILEKISEENKDIKIATIETDDNNDIVTEFQIRSLPTIIYMKDGKEIFRASGVQSKQEVEDKIKELK